MGKKVAVSLKTKILVSTAIAAGLCGAVALTVAIRTNQAEFNEGLVKKAQVIHGRLDVAAQYVASQGGLKPLIQTYTNRYQSSDQLTSEDKQIILKQVPIYAAMNIGATGAEKDVYHFRVFSDEPRNPDNKYTESEKAIFEKFLGDTNLNEWVETTGDHVTVYRPVRLKEQHGCLECHGDPSKSPWRNGRDILGYRMEDWKDGKLHGVFAVKSEVKEVMAAEASAGKTSSTGTMALLILVGAVVSLGLTTLAMRKSLSTLADTSTSLASANQSVEAATGTIQSLSEQLDEASAHQTEALAQTASALDQMRATILTSVERVDLASTKATEAKTIAVSGQKSVQEMLGAMQDIEHATRDISDEINRSNAKFSEIVTVIREIGEKTKVINDIVFQTKLLSFNASVEAARAGEHGKGFAVVAEEVGNLAQMSGAAATEISSLLESSVARVQQTVQETQSNVEKLIDASQERVGKGSAVSKNCAEVFEVIVDKTKDVSQLAVEIANASQEQKQGVASIQSAMEKLDQIAVENKDASGETKKAASDLVQEARTLKKVSNQVTEIVKGEAA